MSDRGRKSHLSPHSTGKPRKTIVGCWRSLNFDPDSFGFYLGEKKVQLQNMKFSCILTELGAAGMQAGGRGQAGEGWMKNTEAD